MVAAIALLPTFAGCSSSSSIDYVADTYPSQSLVDILKGSTASALPAQQPEPAQSAAMAASPAPAISAVPPPIQATVAPPSVASPPPQPTPAPPPAAADEEADPVAAAYPSVSLIDLLTGRKPAQ